MNHLTRALAVLYPLAAAGLLRCAVISEQNGATGYGWFFVGCAVLFGLAVAHHAWHSGQLHADHARLERAARPPGPHPAALADEFAIAWHELETACCLTGWDSHGEQHDPDYCTLKDRTT
ncbi:hypothetical protein ACF09J_07835 [Streptomyces sp. NPDC014889]|uniref:hypothetical protein n=1 Tax=Streptomyces sp. NPDC014889 TaxID=3364928 RepID=UPI0036FDD2D8